MSGPPSRRLVFIAGGAGFIGSHLARHAAALGHDVVALVRPGSSAARLDPAAERLTVLRGDLADLPAISRDIAARRPDICIDAAWSDLRGQSASAGHLTSLRHTLALAELMAEIGCPRYLHTGTCFEYALTDGPITEASAAGAHTLYGACKHAAGVAIRMLGDTSGTLSVAWPRIFYVYGPHEAEHRLVPAVVGGLLGGKPTPTTAGTQVRDYMHVEDVASALWAVAESGLTGPVNIAAGCATPVRQVVEHLGELTGRPDLLRIGALPQRAEEPAAIRADASLLRSLGWEPRYSLEDGLRQTVDWWRGRLGERP